MKNRKLIISIIITICVLFIILVIIQAQLRDSKKNPSSNFVPSQGDSNTNVVSNISNTNVNEDTNDNSIIKNAVNNVDDNVQKTTADEEYKKVLLDEDWVKENLYLKENCFGKTVSNTYKQTVKYMRVKADDFSTPIVLISTEDKKQTSCQCFVMTYADDKIQVNAIDSGIGHSSHVSYGANIRNKVLYKKSVYSLSEEYQIFTLSEKGATKIYTIKEEQNQGSNSTYYINEKNCTEEEYRNVKEKYITETTRGAEFININADDVNKDFK